MSETLPMRRFAFRRHDAAVVDLPLKLLITAVVLAVTVPAGFKTLQHFGRDSAEREAAASMAKLEAAVQQVVSAGVGTSLNVKLDFSGSQVASIEYARAGGDLAKSLSDGTILTFKVNGRPERSHVTEPNVLMQHRAGGPAVFDRGSYKVQLTHSVGTFGPAGAQRDYHFVEMFFLES